MDVLFADCLCFGPFSRSRSLSLSAGSRTVSETESLSLRLESAAGIWNAEVYVGGNEEESGGRCGGKRERDEEG